MLWIRYHYFFLNLWEFLRLVLLSTHYRQPLNWSTKAIDQAKKTLDRLYRVIRKAEAVPESDTVKPSKHIVDALCDDLNTPEALGQLNILFNRFQDAGKDEQKELMPTIYSSAKMLGILQCNPDEWLGYSKVVANDNLHKIEKMIEDRNQFRNEKNFNRADEIRDELKSMGIEIEDTPGGTIWRNEN